MVEIGRGAPAKIGTGTYTGDNAATQSITGVGFQPSLVIIFDHAAGPAWGLALKSASDGVNAWADDWAMFWAVYAADIIVSLDADGFTVGDGTGAGVNYNALGNVYTWIAIG